ncbi:putative secreted protein [Neisseria gonorrhoeae]|uniref:Putative secreted protein n=1 Tax=Neisseria gonorrhoeae TaxID=485 RepID=A0A378W0G8_NEIGO|nr:putative secreted protein [Neisseria gonorrhoeae]
MKSERRHWEWCVDYDGEGVVRDYRFTHKVEKDERSVIRDTVGVIRKEAGNPCRNLKMIKWGFLLPSPKPAVQTAFEDKYEP